MSFIQGMSTEKLAFMDKRIREIVDQKLTQGLTVQVLRNGQNVFSGAYGTREYGENAPKMEMDTIFPMSSISKTFVGTAYMILMERGLIDMSDRVSRFLPEGCHEDYKKMSIGSLLSHSSGLDDGHVRELVMKKWLKQNSDKSLKDFWDIPNEEYLRLIVKEQPLNPHHEKMSYCSTGFWLLGEMMPKICGQTLNDFTRENIFIPLDMKDTYFSVPEELWGRVVQRKPNESGFDRYSSENSLKSTNGAGGAYSTAGDLVRFTQMFLNGGILDGVRLLSPTTIRVMTSNRVPGMSAIYNDEVFKEASWGYGWNVRGGIKEDTHGTMQNFTTLSHGGAGGVLIFFDYEYQLTAAILTIDGETTTRTFINNMIFAAIEDVSPIYRG